MNIAIIGTGLIGRKRALSLPKDIKLTIACDVDENKGQTFSKEFFCQFEKNWRNVIKDINIQALIISTTNNWLSKIAREAILAGKHVLVEKPGAKTSEELKSVYTAYRKKPVVVMFGFNHRLHPAIIKAKELIDSKKFGEVMFIRARYGHGGRLGYEKEWRFQKRISGGGELIDQGPHLIDLVNYLCGQMDNAIGFTTNLFWNTKLEDAAFILLRNKQGQVAQISVTCLEWKNIFSFEIMLTKAKIQIEGLGRSYGQERLILYKMKQQMGPPDIEEFKFPDIDNSWKLENELFFTNINKKIYSDLSIKDTMYVLKTIEKLYKRDKL